MITIEVFLSRDNSFSFDLICVGDQIVVSPVAQCKAEGGSELRIIKAGENSSEIGSIESR